MRDELSEYAHATPIERRRIRNANAAKGAQSRGFQAIGYRNPVSNMPKGGKLSPGTGETDLGLLSQREALAAAQWKQKPGKPVEASKYIPVRRKNRGR